MTAVATQLRISDELALPFDAVTEAFGVIGVRGSGKSFTAKVLTEELTKAGLPVAAMDPLGVWWGLRSSADGERPGLPFVIFGGDHADVPLTQDSGEVVSDFVISERVPVVLDMSLMRKAEMRRFATAFLSRLYHRNRQPLHLVVDEADLFAPQRVDDPTLLGAMEDIVRRGRAKGLGCTLITQRPAVIAKDVLTQISTLIAMRLAGPQDKKALDEWVRANGTEEQRAEFLSSLAALPTGTAWVWSPHWLGLFQKVAIRPLETFDSSATPKSGQAVVEPRAFAPVDLDVLRDRIAATIERAKADDPKELRRRIGELERQLKAVPKAESQTIERSVRVEVPVIPEAFVEDLRQSMGKIRDSLTWMDIALSGKWDGIAVPEAAKPVENIPNPIPSLVAVPPFPPQTRAENENHRPRSEGITAPQQRILDALASFEAFGIAQPSRSNVAVFAGVSSTSGAYANNVSRLNVMRLICYPGTGLLALTDEGRGMANPAQRFDSVERLHEAWYAQLTRPQAAILLEAIGRYPAPIERSELADVLGVSATSGAYANNLSRLHVLGVLDYPSKGSVRATELLFPEVG